MRGDIIQLSDCVWHITRVENAVRTRGGLVIMHLGAPTRLWVEPSPFAPFAEERAYDHAMELANEIHARACDLRPRLFTPVIRVRLYDEGYAVEWSGVSVGRQEQKAVGVEVGLGDSDEGEKG